MKIINIFSGDVVFEEERPLPNEEYLIQYIKELEQEAEAGEKAIAAIEQIGDLVYNNSCHADTSNEVTRIFMAYSKKITPK